VRTSQHHIEVPNGDSLNHDWRIGRDACSLPTTNPLYIPEIGALLPAPVPISPFVQVQGAILDAFFAPNLGVIIRLIKNARFIRFITKTSSGAKTVPKRAPGKREIGTGARISAPISGMLSGLVGGKKGARLPSTPSSNRG